MDPVLAIEDLTKAYGSRVVLDQVNFSVHQGESVAIVGPSGSGKSTLLNIVGLLEDPTSGTVRLAGSRLPHINSRRATVVRRDQVNYLFQSFALINSATTVENIMIGLHSMNEHRRAKKRRILSLLERIGLDHVADEKVMTLSGGERQRVALARCLLKPGELILADEPTGALDDVLADVAISEMLALQREYAKSLLIVTHDKRIANRCDRIVDLAATTATHRGNSAVGAGHGSAALSMGVGRRTRLVPDH